MEKLALHGGPKSKTTPYTLTNKYGDEELEQLTQVIRSGKLMGTDGKVAEFEEALRSYYGVPYAIMVTSGTAALHTALCALGVSEGDEVITTPMTDIGTVSAILALHAIPIFADIDAETRLISSQSIRARITKRTKVIITVHMAGLCCDMNEILEIGNEFDIRILEDCAQSHGATLHGKLLGTIGDASGFSMNESKQVSTGDGGFVLTRDETTAGIAGLFRDKTYIRDGSISRGKQPIPFFAPNFRPTCLQAAVAIAQLKKLPEIVRKRSEIVSMYYDALADLPGLQLPRLIDDTCPSYWPLPARYLHHEVPDAPGRDEIAEAIVAEGIPVSTGLTPPRNILTTEMITKKKYYPLTDTVPAFWRDTEYDPESCPNVDELQRSLLRLPVDERYTIEDIEETITGVRKVWHHFVRA
jgi:perosamine synthetase